MCPYWSFFWIAALLLIPPPVVTSPGARCNFEQMRWRESDYPGKSVRRRCD